MMDTKRGWVLKAMIVGVVVVLAVVALEYPIANLQRMPLDDAARQSLIRSGNADHFVHLGLGTMHVRESGPQNGPVVLLVHGGAIGGYAWRQWQQPLAAAGFRVITPDLLGYGYSDRPEFPYTREFYTRQLVQLLDTQDSSAGSYCRRIIRRCYRDRIRGGCTEASSIRHARCPGRWRPPVGRQRYLAVTGCR
jgi:hypothetical protein